MIKYFGHSSFEIVTKNGKRIVVDPWQNVEGKHWFEREFPEMEADVVIVTHDHFDHNAWEKIGGGPELINGAGDFEYEHFNIRGIRGKHARAAKYNFNENYIFVIEIDGLRICHWGDNQAEVDSEILGKVKDVDVLFVPVDESEHLLDLSEVDKVIEMVNPKIVVPMHYFNSGLTTKESTLKGIDNWVSGRKVKKVSGEGIEINSESLPMEREVWVFARGGK